MSVFKDVKITKRDGRIVDFDPSKIENAIRKANNSVSSESQIPEENIGDIVNFTGCLHYTSSTSNGVAYGCKAGQAKVTNKAEGAVHPYHLQAISGKGSTVYGWVNAGDIE